MTSRLQSLTLTAEQKVPPTRLFHPRPPADHLISLIAGERAARLEAVYGPITETGH